MIKYFLILTLLGFAVRADERQEAEVFIKQIELQESDEQASFIIENVEKTKNSKAFQKNLEEADILSKQAQKAREAQDYKEYENWVKSNKGQIFAKQGDYIAEIDDKKNNDEVANMLQNYRFKPDDIKKNMVQYNPVMIFVSSSIPESSLKDLMVQAKRYKAVLVFRGVVGSLRNTSEFLQKISKQDASAIIDPRLFKIFNIKQVPSFVVLSENSQEILDEFITPNHDKMVGNITLEYVFNHIVENNGIAKETALKYLKKGDYE